MNPASRSRKQPRLTPVSTISRCPCATRRSISASTAAARRLRVPPRTSGMTQKAHENEHPSWIFTNARVRSTRASDCTHADGADVAGDGRGQLLARAGHDPDVFRHGGECAAQVRAAPGDVDLGVTARRPRCSLARLRDRLVGDAARVHDRDVPAASRPPCARRRAGARARPARPRTRPCSPGTGRRRTPSPD